MRIAREYVVVLARDLARHLVAEKQIECADAAALAQHIHAALAEEFAVEDRINEEARAILGQHASELQRLGGNYSEAFKKIKAELVRQKKVVL